MHHSLETGRHPELPSMRARRLQRPNRGEGPCVLARVNTRSLRATRPLRRTRDSLTPFEMTFRKQFE
jgi:hypothetical protein